MTEATPARSLHPVDSTTDAITEVLRRGARKLLAAALDSEVEAFLAAYGDFQDERGHRAVVRNGHLPEREVQTGVISFPSRVTCAFPRGIVSGSSGTSSLKAR